MEDKQGVFLTKDVVDWIESELDSYYISLAKKDIDARLLYCDRIVAALDIVLNCDREGG